MLVAGNGSKMMAGNYFPNATVMKNFSINRNKLHAALVMLTSAGVSIALIAWAVQALNS